MKIPAFACRPPGWALLTRVTALTDPTAVPPSAASAPAAAAPAAHRMTPLERRASGGLALIFALRMLGLFLVLPVFALEARHYPGGDDPALVGLALGVPQERLGLDALIVSPQKLFKDKKLI